MDHQFSSNCSVCGDAVGKNDFGYLLSAHPITNRIQVFRWSRESADFETSLAACTLDHVIEIVALWMATGQLDLTFAKTRPPCASPNLGAGLSMRGLREPRRPGLVGEIAIDYEDAQHLIGENPKALASILDFFLEALQRDLHFVPCASRPPKHVDRFTSSA